MDKTNDERIKKTEMLHQIRCKFLKNISSIKVKKMLGFYIKKTETEKNNRGFKLFNVYDVKNDELLVEDVEEWDLKMIFELIGLDLYEILRNSSDDEND